VRTSATWLGPGSGPGHASPHNPHTFASATHAWRSAPVGICSSGSKVRGRASDSEELPPISSHSTTRMPQRPCRQLPTRHLPTRHLPTRHLRTRCCWLQPPPPPRCRYAQCAPWHWRRRKGVEPSPVCTHWCSFSLGSSCESSTSLSTPHPIKYAADAVKAPMIRISRPESHQDLVV